MQWSSGSGGAIYYNGGNVGIGTAGPIARLDVATPSPWSALTLSDGASQPLGFIARNANNGSQFGLNTVNGTTWTRVVNLDTNGPSYLMGGNLGIGTAGPSAQLHVAKAGGAAQSKVGDDSASTSTGINGLNLQAFSDGNNYIGQSVRTLQTRAKSSCLRPLT